MSPLPLLLVFEVMGWKVLSNHYVTGEYLVDGIPCRQIYICGVQCQYNKLLCPGWCQACVLLGVALIRKAFILLDLCPVNDGKILGCHLTQNTQSLEIDSVVSEKSWWGNLAMVICWISRVDGQTLDCWRWLWGVNVRPRLILVHFLLTVQNQLKIGQSLVNFLTSDLVSHWWSSKKWIEDSYLEELLQ